jgi:hypothetical protein
MQGPAGLVLPSGGGLTNTGPFRNLQPARGNGCYWAGQEYAGDGSSAWQFDVFYGAQSYNLKSNGFYAWAVRSGDVAVAVPEPQTCTLALAGLAVAFGAAKRRKP